MKNDPVSKLYSGLTDKERAALSYRYLWSGDAGDFERRRIESTMPMQNFVGLPYDYRRAFGGCISLAQFYAIAHWKQVAECLAFLSATTALLGDADTEAYLPVRERFKTAEGCLLAIEQAFDAVCDEHGIDPVTARIVAGSRFYEIAHADLAPNAECLAGMREIFVKVLQG